MSRKIDQPKIVILGMGNLLLQDEGVGIHLIQMLSKDALDYANLEIIDGGTSPESLLTIEGVDKLIIIDAVKGGKEPGTIYCFGLDDVILDSSLRLSLHQMSMIDSLRILNLIDKQPKNIVIIGIEPKNIDFGLGLSPEVREKLAELKDLAIKEVKSEVLIYAST